MTLFQANAEAVQRHYGLHDTERPALAITAYLTSRGAGTSISPGIVAGQPVFESRLRALAESVKRGERLYARQCRSCHEAASPSLKPFQFAEKLKAMDHWSVERQKRGAPPTPRAEK